MGDKITIQICRFDIPSKSAGKLINKESVKKVINSDRFKQNLAKGRVLSLLTHSDRYAVENKNIPYEDQILISKDLAGYGKRAWIDESRNAFFGEIELANNDNGRLVKDMLKKGFDLSTSMSVSATADDKYYYIEDILSLGDFTTRPDLEAKVVKIDFSQKRLANGSNLVTFSQLIPNKEVHCSFASDIVDTYTSSEDSDIEAEVCPICGNPYESCSCHSPKYKVGVYSESTLIRPQPNIVQETKLDINKVKPVDNTLVGGSPVVTNLDTGVAGVGVSPLFCSAGFDPTIVNPEVSIETVHAGIPVEDQMSIEDIAKFPAQLTSTVQAQITSNFSIRDMIREWRQPPRIVLRQRINEVVQQCRAAKQDWIDQNSDNLKAYFDSYILTWINSALASDKEFNISMGLKLADYGVKMQSMTRLNRAIKRMKQNMDSTGYMPKQIQEELNSAYQDIEDQLYKYIDNKLGPKIKFAGNNETKVTKENGKK